MSVVKYEAPTMKEGAGTLKEGVEYSHPAYGVVTLHDIQGGDGVLFGSDVKNYSCLRIEVKQATLTRDLHRDWIHGHGLPHICIEMSHHQFSEWLTGTNKGSGVPCTIRYIGTEQMPHIKPPEPKHETMHKEIRQKTVEAIAEIRKLVADMEAVTQAPGIPRGKIRDLVRSLKVRVENLPSNMEFAAKSAEETIEKMVTSAKIEVEAYVGATAKRLGLEQISDLEKLTYAPKKWNPKDHPAGEDL